MRHAPHRKGRAWCQSFSAPARAALTATEGTPSTPTCMNPHRLGVGDHSERLAVGRAVRGISPVDSGMKRAKMASSRARSAPVRPSSLASTYSPSYATSAQGRQGGTWWLRRTLRCDNAWVLPTAVAHGEAVHRYRHDVSDTQQLTGTHRRAHQTRSPPPRPPPRRQSRRHRPGCCVCVLREPLPA